MENILNSIDTDKHIGVVTLSNGKYLKLPKLSNFKIIRIVKFIGIDGIRMYDQAREILLDDTLVGFERYAHILESLKEEQLIRILSILLDVSDEEALQLDLNETLDILIEYADKTNLGKTFTQVRQLVKKLFKKELPDFKTLLDQWFPKVEMEDIPVGESFSEQTMQTNLAKSSIALANNSSTL
ncbi:hypothetical protein ABR776_27335 [Bacillus cereus]|uniref:Uncharacterized protein n=1 Tax=Bacillus cereus TaxID=1396 RepID=A0A1C4FNS9_BACCE|nr:MULTISPECIES: hypothetical protein [Bacillus cereus group]HDR7784901.1 hypothetical protein [Bacillus wiedmannii]MCU5435777.1 hypothetical protein [Bacillus mobilis]OKA27381.1 hypothetical protein BJR06_30175 [Bacillus cereus]OKA30468.1 hypothetical protein BJR07_29820 [Bacillus cereus]SCC57542.1 Uncharacterized protein BC0861_06158 [Bacillus mobilis]